MQLFESNEEVEHARMLVAGACLQSMVALAPGAMNTPSMANYLPGNLAAVAFDYADAFIAEATRRANRSPLP